MKGKLLRGLIVLLLAMSATPVLAEKLSFDHRLYQPLKDVLDSGRDDMIQFNAKDPAYVTDLIVIRGKSVRNWTEAMIIIARTPGPKVRTAADWLAELKQQSEAECASQFSIIAQDDSSITAERSSQGCRPGYPAFAIYRIVQGKKGLFLLGAMSKDGFAPEARSAWLALLGSAKLD
jgi:hypothetical protein